MGVTLRPANVEQRLVLMGVAALAAGCICTTRIDAMQVCQRVAELYPKNYYAWTQRSWVVLRVVGGAFWRAGADAGTGRRSGAGDGAKVVGDKAGDDDNVAWSSCSPFAEELVSLVVLVA